MINLNAQDVVENLAAILSLVKTDPVYVTDESGQKAILVSFELYSKLIQAEAMGAKLAQEADIPDPQHGGVS